MKHELYRDWCEHVLSVVLKNQEKTFLQLVELDLVITWSEYYLSANK